MKNYKFGAIPSPTDPRDYEIPSGSGSNDFPKEYSSLKGLGYKAKNQGQVNSCVSFALATAMELNAKNTADRRSNGFIYHNRELMDYKGEGMYVRDALKSAQKVGCCLWEDYTENIEVPEGYKVFNSKKEQLIPKANQCKIGNYYYINVRENPKYPNTPLGLLDVDATKRAIMDNGFVLVCFFVFPTIYEVDGSNPILDYPDLSKDAPMGSHAVIITGWTEDDLWEVVNSWGEGFAVKGIFYTPLDYPFHEAWTFDTLVTDKPEGNDGWYKVGEDWHYRKDGEDATGWIKVKGKWYFLNSEGIMLTGWIEENEGVWYWLEKNGAMAVGWRLIGGRWYYFASNGIALRGVHNIDGKWYCFADMSVGNIKQCQCIITDKNGAIV